MDRFIAEPGDWQQDEERRLGNFREYVERGLDFRNQSIRHKGGRQPGK